MYRDIMYRDVMYRGIMYRGIAVARAIIRRFVVGHPLNAECLIRYDRAAVCIGDDKPRLGPVGIQLSRHELGIGRRCGQGEGRRVLTALTKCNTTSLTVSPVLTTPTMKGISCEVSRRV